MFTCKVLCFPKPVIGVISTGNELVDPWETPVGSQIRDSNRAALIASFEEEGYKCIDFGIVKDQKTNLRNTMIKAIASCDVCVSSGGVSMGEADYVKPTLNELGKVHFSKLNMKPGKPTTFASFKLENSRNCLFFALPGNPASCLVTKSLFVDPACKVLSGYPLDSCLPPQIKVKFDGDAIKLDPERPEYHRALLSQDVDSQFIVRSTGNQRSSRLLSMRSANSLLCLPQGPGAIQPGDTVVALLTGEIPSPLFESAFHQINRDLLANLKENDTEIEQSNQAEKEVPSKDSRSSLNIMRVGLLTISDRVRVKLTYISFKVLITLIYKYK